tara:strand:- start:136 stop:252 length:117 start_codon:yes stop_codon:yes gene_type:complete
MMRKEDEHMIRKRGREKEKIVTYCSHNTYREEQREMTI